LLDVSKNLIENRVVESALSGNPSALEEMEKVLSPKDYQIFLYLKSMCETSLPEEAKLLNEDIFAVAVRFADKYDWASLDISGLGMKQTALYSISKIKNAIALLSAGNIDAAEAVAKKIFAVSKEEKYRDEAENILAYVSLLQGRVKESSQKLLDALDSEYTTGLVHNAFYISNKMEKSDASNYVSEVLAKSPSPGLREKALYSYLATIAHSMQTSDLDEDSDAPDFEDFVDDGMVKHAKSMFLSGCSIDNLQIVVKIIAAKEKHFFLGDEAKRSPLWDTVECQFLVHKEAKPKELSEFFYKYSPYIRKSIWASNKIADFIAMFADMGIITENAKASLVAFQYLDELGVEGLGSKLHNNLMIRVAPGATNLADDGILNLDIIQKFANSFTEIVKNPEDMIPVGSLDLSSDPALLGSIQKQFAMNVIRGVKAQYQSLIAMLPNPNYRNTQIREALNSLSVYLIVLNSMEYAFEPREVKTIIKALQVVMV
jgi:hypothetical protein